MYQNHGNFFTFLQVSLLEVDTGIKPMPINIDSGIRPFSLSCQQYIDDIAGIRIIPITVKYQDAIRGHPWNGVWLVQQYGSNDHLFFRIISGDRLRYKFLIHGSSFSFPVWPEYIKKEAGKIRELTSLNLPMLPPFEIPVKSRQPIRQIVASTHLISMTVEKPYFTAIPVTRYQLSIYHGPHQRLIAEFSPAEVAFVTHQFHSFWAIYIWESAWATASIMRQASS